MTILIANIVIIVFFLVVEHLWTFFSYFSGNFKLKIIHAFRNGSMGFLNRIFVWICFVPLWDWITQFYVEKHIGVLNQFSMEKNLHLICSIIILDFVAYIWHKFNHEWSFLWKFHKVHHTDPYMDVTTAVRFHIIEIILSAILRTGVILTMGVPVLHVFIYETILFFVIVFHHANIALPEKFDRIIRVFIVTPAIHKVHHSCEQLETDTNYSSLFSIWDRIFGTLCLKKNLKEINFGLNGFDEKKSQTIIEMVKIPFL